MRHYQRVFFTLLVSGCIISLLGCAELPRKDAGRQDTMIENLTGENAALRKEIKGLTRESDKLRGENLKLKSKLEEQSNKNIK